ncbi:hypothetical protein HBB16_11935 [Pseudonocardia sp. MCCB 268]|nr:hypothetical protein [Pseudonocardia cytotoxica]
MLLRGPSRSWRARLNHAVPGDRRLRSAVTKSPDGAVVIDSPEVSGLSDRDRRLLAARSHDPRRVSVPRLRLLSDGDPLLPDRPEGHQDDFAGMVMAPDQLPSFPMVTSTAAGSTSSASGRETPRWPARRVTARSTSSTPPRPRGSRITDGLAGDRHPAAADRPGRGQLTATPVSGATVTALNWNAAGDEIWAVADGRLRRVAAPAGATGGAPLDAERLAGLGELRRRALPRGGGRIAVVAGGRALVGPVVASPGGSVSISSCASSAP